MPLLNTRISIRKWVVPLLLGVLVFTMAISLRIFRLKGSYDIFIDEISYLRLSQSVQTEGWPDLYDQPFHLHPPGFFYLQAAYLSFVDLPNDLIQQVYMTRYLNVILASLTAVLLFWISYSVAGHPWGLFGAMLFGIDAFVIRMNSRNLLDTAAVWWVTAGYALLVIGLDNANPKLPKWRILLTGLCFGCGILTKDMTFFVSLLPLLALFVTGYILPRVYTLVLSVLTALVYSVYPAAVVYMGEWADFSDDKLSGITRLLGHNKETGLNRAHGPSFIEKIAANAVEFSMTYFLIGAGTVAILVLLARGKRVHRLLALWGIGSYGLLGYSILFGTLEEQFFYLLIVPSSVMVTLAIPLVFRWLLPRKRLYRIFLWCVILFVVVFVASSSQEWIARHFALDNGYEQAFAYIRQNMRPTGQVASTSETGQFILDNFTSGPWGSWYSVEDLLAYQPEYVLVSYDQVDWDYGAQADDMLQWVEDNGTRIYDFKSRTNHLALYQLTFESAE